MQRSSAETQKFDCHRALFMVVFATMMISCMLNGANARAATVMPSDNHLAGANDTFADPWQIAVVFRTRPPRRIRPKRMEQAVDRISTSAREQGADRIGIHLASAGLVHNGPVEGY